MTKTKKNNESLFAMPLYCAPFTNQRFVRGKKILTRALYLPVLVLLLASKKHGNYRSKICTSNSKVSKVLVPSAREHSEISKGATCVTAKVESKEKHSEHATILQIVSKIKKTIDKKKLILSSSNLLITISGGQDSIFLLFCFFFLQSQLDFCIKIVWCNHFWQIDSFYTTLHLTKTAQAFSSPVIGFIPLHLELESKTVQSADLRKYRSACPYPCSFLPLYSAPFTNQRFVYPERNPVRAKGNTFFDPSLLTPKRDKYNQVFFLPLLKSSILTGTRSKSRALTSLSRATFLLLRSTRSARGFFTNPVPSTHLLASKKHEVHGSYSEGVRKYKHEVLLRAFACQRQRHAKARQEGGS